MKKLTQNNNRLFLEFLLKKPIQNTYILGNYFKYGTTSPDVSFYFELNDSNDFKYVLMSYYSDFVFFTLESLSEAALIKIKKNISKKNFRVISGDDFSIAQILNISNNSSLRKTTLMTLSSSNKNYIADKNIKKLNEKDIDKSIELLKSIDEFKHKFSINAEKRVKRMIQEDEAYGYFIDSKLIAMLNVTSKSTYSCMLTDICVGKEYRGKGFAKKIISHVSEKLVSEGVQYINLYVDNLHALKLYESLGFSKTGDYYTLRKK